MPHQPQDTRQLIDASIEESMKALSYLRSPEALQFMQSVANLLATAFTSQRKVIVAGNGGSLCDAMHFAEELTGYFRAPRKALPALVLSDPGHITCVANDAGYETVFSRGIEAFGHEGDVFLALSTSGNSKNLIQAALTAKQHNITTVCLLGKGGGPLLHHADYALVIPQCRTSDHIQEAHMACLHTIIEAVEQLLFANEKFLGERI